MGIKISQKKTCLGHLLSIKRRVLAPLINIKNLDFASEKTPEEKFNDIREPFPDLELEARMKAQGNALLLSFQSCILYRRIVVKYQLYGFFPWKHKKISIQFFLMLYKK